MKSCLFFLALLPAAPALAGSVCHGGVSRGSIERSVALPAAGANFQAYTTLAAMAGRTRVHDMVAAIVLQAYAAAAAAQPAMRYVYGETGLAEGGPFPPHRSHQNGTSVDFFVPVRDADGRPSMLPSDSANHFGYDAEFDRQGRYQRWHIDFDAMAEHLYQLHRAAQPHGGLALVIFDPVYLPALFATARGAYLRRQLVFMKGKPWVRHDEHYHVDFAIRCQP